MFILQLIGALSLGAWIYLFFGRGGFWRVRESVPPKLNLPARSVVAVIPARNEEAVIGKAVASLLNQHYPGSSHVIVVDDHSTDATVSAAGKNDRLTIVLANPLPQGWTGKLWALAEGLKQAEQLNPDYILLTDADIVHAPDNIAGLVARAETENLDLVSLMVKLECQTTAERALIPAFVFFFLKLYPPAWIASRKHKTAGAAGGCMLIRPAALKRIGGIAAIRGELIDDCALAKAVKKGGDIWLGLTENTRSIREYSTLADVRQMISRTAFTQLRYSAWLLAGTVLGMSLIYLAPPLLLLSRDLVAGACGLGAWMLMSITYLPTVRFYNRSILRAPALPLIALFYVAATIESALRYWTGRGGYWKNRVQAT